VTSLIIAKEITQGDTFKAGITVTRTVSDVVGPVDLTGVTITSKAKTLNGVLVAVMDIIVVDLVNGKFQVRSESSVSDAESGGGAWPRGKLKWDIQFIEAGDTWSMPVRGILVGEDNT